MNSIKIFLTFDYELPLGGIKKSYKHSLFNPTDELLDVLDTIKVKGVFFADILSFIMFEKWEISDYTLPFANQISNIISRGHDVQLHLHPHWLDSSFINGKIFPSEKYSLGDFAEIDPEENIFKIVNKGIERLSDICRKTDPDYKCIAYRAGGYNLFPFTKEIIAALMKCGIKYDSSISPGYFFRSDSSIVNYRKVPKQPNWYLSSDGDFSKNGKDTVIYEIPIASKPKNLFEIPTTFKIKRYKHRAVEERGSMIHSNLSVPKSDKIRQLFSSRMLTVDNHTYSPGYLLDILNYNIRRYNKHNTINLSLIGHPKSMDSYHYFLLKEFIKLAHNMYGNKLKFCTFRNY